MPPTSYPVSPLQPDEAIYGLDRLQLFKTYTRDSYFAAFGVQAPDFDASQAAKAWFDSTADASTAGNLAVYTVFDVNGNQAHARQLQIPASLAARVNLPGLMSYPPYSPAPTPATLGTGAPLTNLDVLIDLADAQALAAELGGLPVVDVTFHNPIFSVNYNGETRRMWGFIYRGSTILAGPLRAQQYARGIGRPGKWDTTSPDQPTWIPRADPPDGVTTGVPTSFVPVPVRGLLANEKIVSTLTAAEIARTDMSSAATQGDGYTSQDRATLIKILTALQRAGLA